MDIITQSLRDISSMSTKSFDQLDRTGAFHHQIRRKAAAQESGLITLKDIQNEIACSPLIADGISGKKLKEKLKERKEQKDSWKYFIPVWNDRGQKKNSVSQMKAISRDKE